MNVNTSEIESRLTQFNGSETWYRHWLPVIYSEGVKYLADQTQCYWLIDAIASHYKKVAKNAIARQFCFWTLTVNPGSSAKLQCWEW